MRGKDCAFFILSPLYRITPAHAGKRARLEVMRRTGKGSPPHMRGKVNLAVCSCRQRRITPAHAGKSPRALRRPGGRRDHPRTCGEKALLFLGLPLMLGSPPHMRGKAQGFHPCTPGSRITPAHAGKRLKRSRSIVPHAAIVPLFPSVCNKPAGSDGSPAGHDAPPFLPIENAAPASPAYNLRSL